MARDATCCNGKGCDNCSGSGDAEDQPVALVEFGDAGWHSGPGWYYWDDEYPDEGSVGVFQTREEAEAHAREAGYRIDEGTRD
jgi:hypothetical protein